MCGAIVSGRALNSGSTVRRYGSLGDDQCNTAHAWSLNLAAAPALSSMSDICWGLADWVRRCSARQMAIDQHVLGDIDKSVAQWWETLFVRNITIKSWDRRYLGLVTCDSLSGACCQDLALCLQDISG